MMILFNSFSTALFDSKVASEERSVMRKSFIRSNSMLSGSNSSCSSLTNDDDVSSEEKIKSRTVSFFSATARYRQMKFKIVRKIRSKVIWTSLCSGNRNGNVAAAAKVSPGCNSGEASSCLSSNLNGISSARSLRYAKRDNRCVRTVDDHAAAKSVVGSPHLRRRAEAILKLLSIAGGSSELKIRQMLGDSPDTSKALRMLLRVDAVKRSGSGGRRDPYVYMGKE
ncbi:unnamed protein product [Lupinus luteus]|uniref:HTH three-helical bundle domain-containing protein n=1 Tax=Lupinus luteus TaxID=3873 RepID=A0AAV1XIA8_LUPLU